MASTHMFTNSTSDGVNPISGYFYIKIGKLAAFPGATGLTQAHHDVATRPMSLVAQNTTPLLVLQAGSRLADLKR